jgi:hypothetical protein
MRTSCRTIAAGAAADAKPRRRAVALCKMGDFNTPATVRTLIEQLGIRTTPANTAAQSCGSSEARAFDRNCRGDNQ